MSIRVEAKSLDLALVRAAGQLGVPQERLAYEVEEKSEGFLGLFGKKVTVKAWVKSDRPNRNDRQQDRHHGRRDDRRDDRRHGARNESRFDNRDDNQGETERKEGDNRREAREGRSDGRGEGRGESRGEGRRGNDRNRSRRNDRFQNRNARPTRVVDSAEVGEDDDDQNVVVAQPLTEAQLTQVKAELSGFVAEIVQKMLGEEVTVEANLEGERMIFDIQNEYLSAQIAKNIKIAESFEHLMRKKPRELKQELPFRVFVDAMKARLSREAELAEMAKDLSNKVHESQRPIVLNYRRSYDRKIIHMALDQDERVFTKSIGKGPNRKLMILPAGTSADINDATEIEQN